MSNEINQQDNLGAWERIITDNLTKGKSLPEVIAFMVKSGWTEEDAQNLASSLAQRMYLGRSIAELQKREKARSYRNRMIRGLIWTVVGLIITGATYLFTEPGGKFVICWGAVLFGVIDFLVGFFGWINNL